VLFSRPIRLNFRPSFPVFTVRSAEGRKAPLAPTPYVDPIRPKVTQFDPRIWRFLASRPAARS
jgi:hypothetical protein